MAIIRLYGAFITVGITLLLGLAACAPSPTPTQPPEVFGRWELQGEPGLSVPNSFFWFSMDYIEFRADGRVLGLMRWPPGDGAEIRLNKTAEYTLRGDNQLEITGSCRHQDPCTGVYTLTRTADSLKIADGSRVLNLQWVGPPAETVPPPAPGPSPSPTPVAETPLSPADALLFVAGGIQLLDVATGQPRFRLDVTRGAIVRHLFIPQTDLLAIATTRNEILLVDLAAGSLRHTLSGQNYSRFLAASPDGRWLAAGGNDDTVQVWGVIDGELRQTLTEQPYSYGLAFSPDGKRLAIGSLDNTLIIWDVASGQAVQHFQGHASRIRRLWVSPDERYLVAEDLTSIKIWEVESGQLQRSFDKEPPADFLVTGGQVIVPQNDRTVVWQWGNGVISSISNWNSVC